MNNGQVSSTEIPAAARRLAHRAMSLGANRVELLLVELQLERERLMHALAYAVGVAVFAMLGGISLTAFIILATWNLSPLMAAGILTVLYFAIAAFLYAQVARLQRDWQAFSATLDQLRKDSECLNTLLH